MKLWISFAALLVTPSLALSATYYVDFLSGSDLNSGASKASSWKRAPGMNGFAGTYSHSAGDQFIFKGGVTWDNTIAPWLTSAGGSATGGSGANCASMTVSTAQCDYYGVDQTWYTGGAWSQPVFDGGSQLPIPGPQVSGYFHFTGSYLTIDNLRVQNIGIAGVGQDNYALNIGGHDTLIENMTLAVESRIGIVTGVSNQEIRNNDISKCSWGIGGGASPGNKVISNILVHDNVFHDFHSQQASGSHGDEMYFYSIDSDPTAYIDNLRFYNNMSYGDFTASDGPFAIVRIARNQAGTGYRVGDIVTPKVTPGAGASFLVYSVGVGGAVTGLVLKTGGANYKTTIGALGKDIPTAGGSGSGLTVDVSWVESSGMGAMFRVDSPNGTQYAYNNHASMSSGSTFSTMIWVNGNGSSWSQKYGYRGHGTFHCFNNSFIVPSSAGWGISASMLDLLEIKNNIIVGTSFSVYLKAYGPVDSYVINYNLMNGWGSRPGVIYGNPDYNNWAAWQAGGYDVNGVHADPLFVNATDSGSGANLQLQLSTPASGKGMNLFSIFTMDAVGSPRPNSGPWDLGAYQLLNPPTNLKLTVR